MEFPDLGKNCALKGCNQLDFLPFKCQYCKQYFCESHWKVDTHTCAQKHLVQDYVVPDCPLCGQVVSIRRGEDPNIAVDRHIQGGCKKRTMGAPAYKKGCQFRRCNDKVLVLTTCQYCRKEFCLKHRFESDHQCTGGRAQSAPPNSAKSGIMKGLGLGKKAVSTKPSPVRTGAPRKQQQQQKAGGKDTGCIIA
ncbi:hypothetical protein DL89DRAFT_225173 [Linderina pennispora]|uniref:AN1-type domain-containing protein n=1 Tax=Linderina pennispora TaxID=61395 RepID=A0A1Y1W3V8_9FUNG|nr:uncharacterized protein DL89DRAFT_225173 [Linderina pennispora]ORX68137.1 hypothetical protein DL89DRAFT_225173 [Linderina pennispora]